MAKSAYGAMKGTSGKKNDGVAERTVVERDEGNDGGGGAEIVSAASAIYRGAVRNEGGGDSALKTR